MKTSGEEGLPECTIERAFWLGTSSPAKCIRRQRASQTQKGGSPETCCAGLKIGWLLRLSPHRALPDLHVKGQDGQKRSFKPSEILPQLSQALASASAVAKIVANITRLVSCSSTPDARLKGTKGGGTSEATKRINI